MEDQYNVVIDTLQKRIDEIEEMQKGCDRQRMVIGGGMGLMDCIRYEQMDELRQAIKREQALAAEPAQLVRLTDEEIAHVLGDEIDNVYLQDFHKVMDAMIAKNGGV